MASYEATSAKLSLLTGWIISSVLAGKPPLTQSHRGGPSAYLRSQSYPPPLLGMATQPLRALHCGVLSGSLQGRDICGGTFERLGMVLDMPKQWIEEGDPRSPLWLIGEAPGFYEEQRGRPFAGPSGDILNSTLREAGISRSDCFLTNICHQRPPSYTDRNGRRVDNDIEQFFLSKTAAKAAGISERMGRHPALPITDGLERLRKLADAQPPRVAVLLGNTPLWGLTGNTGITKWRGSIIDCGDPPIRTVCAFHPADCLPNRSPHHRPLLVHDLTRARRELECPSPPPHWQHCIAPALDAVRDWLSDHSGMPLTADIETRHSQIACIGLASSSTEAVCIPFMQAINGEHGYSYWSPEDELAVIEMLHSIATRSPLTFHNGLFDCQYFARQWGLAPLYHDDTMVMQHVLYPGLLGGKIDPVSGRVDKRGSSLSLAFISSIYCRHYRFWKDDGRLFDLLEGDEEDLWRYNCEDCCRTFECSVALRARLEHAKLTDQYRFEMSCIPLTLRMMWRGLAVKRPNMEQQHASVLQQMRECREWLDTVTGCDFNPESTPQMRALFYVDLAVPIRRDKKTRQPSLKDHDLDRIKHSHPLLAPLITTIQDYRTLDTIKDDLDTHRLSRDDRLRTALNPDYVETFRYSSNETAFGEGGNLQNIPRSPEE